MMARQWWWWGGGGGGGGDGEANGVDLQIPFLARTVEVDDDFFKGQLEFFEGDVSAVGPGAAVVGVEGDFGRGSVGCCC